MLASSASSVPVTHLEGARRLGVIGDVHAEHVALRVVLDYFASRGADALLSVGDLVDGAGDVNRTLDLLDDRLVLAVAGNHDRWLLAGEMRDLPDATPASSLSARSRTFLTRLPRERELVTPLGRVLLCHGLSTNDLVAVRPDAPEEELAHLNELCELKQTARYSLVIDGHTHWPMLRRVGPFSIVNPGTLHRRYRQTSALLDLDRRVCEVFDVRDEHIELAASWSLGAELAYLPREAAQNAPAGGQIIG